MTTLIVDTDVVSILLTRDTRAHLYRPHLQDRTLALSFMTVAELSQWAYVRNWVGPFRCKMRGLLLRPCATVALRTARPAPRAARQSGFMARGQSDLLRDLVGGICPSLCAGSCRARSPFLHGTDPTQKGPSYETESRQQNQPVDTLGLTNRIGIQAL
jgi:hypothetical protein